jgi:hypothetical protein
LPVVLSSCFSLGNWLESLEFVSLSRYSIWEGPFKIPHFIYLILLFTFWGGFTWTQKANVCVFSAVCVWVTFLPINYLSVTSLACCGCTNLFELGYIVTACVACSLHRNKLSSCNFLAVYHFHIIH